MKFLKRLFPKDLTGQLILLLLTALVLAQAAAFQVIHDERQLAQRTVFKSQVLERIAAASRLISLSPHALRPQVLQALQTENLRFWIAAEPSLKRPGETPEALAVQNKLAQLLQGQRRELRLHIQTEEPTPRDVYMHHSPMMDDDRLPGMMRPRDLPPDLLPGRRNFKDRNRQGDGEWKGPQHGAWRQCIDPSTGTFDTRCLQDWRSTRGRNTFVIAASASIMLPDGLWLNVETSLEPPQAPWALPTLVTFGLSALLTVLVVIFTVRRITRPMQQMAQAAESLGRGESVPELPETGPASFRATTRAFNLMNKRLQRFVNDRMRFLAAVSHDLRTPLTSLRLRSEFVDDDETRERILATIEEMQEMIDGILAFVREDTQSETSNRVDITSLVESVCDDFSDLGRPVALLEPETNLPDLSCRPLSIKRALRNLIDNALKYGETATVSLSYDKKTVSIHVDDQGQGLKQEDLDRIFDPFVRLEASRNRETGGVGLGLSIARTIAQSHGGGLEAENRQAGGLRMTLRLPY